LAHIRQPADTSSSPGPATDAKEATERSPLLFCVIEPSSMEYYVYVLFSPTYDRIYIGFSNDVEARFKSHNELATKGWTKRFRPWVLVYQEAFASKREALTREKQLKSAKGREFIRKLIIKL
jgi:putative endonuclease